MRKNLLASLCLAFSAGILQAHADAIPTLNYPAERDIEMKYVLQSGPAKDLSFRVRQASFRSPDRGLNFNEVRLITEYSINVFRSSSP